MKIRAFMISLIVVILLGTLGIPAVGAQAPASCVNVITVWDGDTLYGIARLNNFNVAELAAVNGLTLTTRLQIGQRLCVDGLAVAQQPPPIGGGDPDPVPGVPPPINTNPNLNFIRGQGPLPAGATATNVLFGDTLFSIARRFQGTTVQGFASLNRIVNIHQIFVGESLIVPAGGTNTGGNTGGNTNVPAHVPAPGTIPVIGIPAQARSGDSIGVTGANFPGNTPVDIYFEKPSLGLTTNVVTTITTNPDGTFNQLITVPNTFSNGAPLNNLPSVSVSGYTRTGGYWAMNYFYVTR